MESSVEIKRATDQHEGIIRPVSLAQVMDEVESAVAAGHLEHLRPFPTGFLPLDDVLNGGLRRGELLIIGGPTGVGKTIWGLQVARNFVCQDAGAAALYVCYEHSESHLLSRLLCLESAEMGYKDDALTMRRLTDFSLHAAPGVGLMGMLRRVPRYAAVLDRVASYAGRLLVVSASGRNSTLDEVQRWTEQALETASTKLILVVDYLQKIPVPRAVLEEESEVTVFLAHGLKELAKALNIPVIAVAAADRPGLKSKRMRFADLRGSSALQYEADIGLILNNKYAILSREHLIYNPLQAEAMRNWVVISVEKNRAGVSAVDMEYALDAAHFRIVPTGNFVRERLVDEKVILE
ncbi:MAG: helicase DnaB [Anaerolineae bacterium]|nr:helicase DnaB [Anaerolineae bacterium]